MASKMLCGQIIILFCNLLPISSSTCYNYPAVFNFGDSNSDTGGLVAGMGSLINPPNGQIFFNVSSGRHCDGRLIVDFLMDAMQLPFLNPYLDSIGAPSFQHGSNFAASSATILPSLPGSICPFSFGVQVDHFIRFKTRVLELLHTADEKIDEYMPMESSFKEGLYMFDIGQNDITFAFYSKSLDEILLWIPSVLLEFETGIKNLYDHGARNFWIHNTGPQGCLPFIIVKFGTDQSKLDEHGCVISHNEAAKVFNLHLHSLCKRLQNQYSDANITYVDTFTIKSNLISNHFQYGFVEPIMACYGYGGPPLNYDGHVTCGQTGSSAAAKVCSNSSEYVNWDGIHFTEAANHHIASQILTGRYSDPPFSDQMPLLLKMKL